MGAGSVEQQPPEMSHVFNTGLMGEYISGRTLSMSGRLSWENRKTPRRFTAKADSTPVALMAYRWSSSAEGPAQFSHIVLCSSAGF